MTTTPAPDTVALLARATVYLHLAQALAYPTDRRLAELWSNRFVEVLGAAVGALDEVGSLEAALDQLKQAIAMLRDSSPGLPEEHTCLFARQVQAAPYETSYGRDFAFGRMRELEEVAAYYAAFGLRVSPHHPERLDHLGVELEFVGALCAKEAYAWKARERFVATHLAGWLPEFVARLKANARLAFYPAVMALALTLVQTERGELAAGAVRE